MNSSNLPKGVITASLTPFNKDLKPDHGLLLEHCQQILGDGGHGILLLGTTGEANSLSFTERIAILEELLKGGLSPDSLLVGTGTSSLSETIDLTRHAIDCGVPNVLVMPPFYYRKVTEEGLFRYFSEVFSGVQAEVNMYYYHFPAMSGIDISMELLDRLIRSFPGRFVGMKDSSGDLAHMLEILDRFSNFKLYSGTERLLTETLDRGSQGCISATTNYSIKAASEVYRTYISGEDHTLQKEIMLAYRAAFEGFVFTPAIKGVLHAISGNENWQYVRPPLTLPTKSDLDKLIRDIRAIA